MGISSRDAPDVHQILSNLNTWTDSVGKVGQIYVDIL